MKRTLLSLSLIAMSFGAVRAAEPIIPSVELRVKALNDLLGYSGYVGGIVGQEELFEQYANAAKAFAGKKGLEGFDTKRPIGLYAAVTKDVSDSPVILLVPVVDEPAVLALFKDKLNLKVKADGGVYETTVPQFPHPIYFKFADGYLHATFGNKANLDRAVAPKTFFAEKPDAVASLAVHLEKVPADVKKVLLGQVEFHLQKEKDRVKTDEPSASKRRIASYALDAVSAVLKSLFDDGKTLGLALNLDPATDELTTELKLTPKSGSALATAMNGAGKKVTTTAGRVAGTNPAMAASINLALPEKWREKLVPVVDDILNDAEAGVDANFAEYFKKILSSFEPTMKMGDVDFALALNGPDDAGKHKLHAFVKTKKMIDLIDALKDLAKILPASIIESKFDATKVNGSGLHSFSFHEQPGDLERLFDSKTIYMGVKDDLLSLGFEPEGKGLKTALAETPKSKSVFSAEFAVARLAVMVAEGDKKPKMQKMVKDIFGSTTAGADTLKLDVNAGDAVTVRIVAKGKALRTLQAMDKVNKE